MGLKADFAATPILLGNAGSPTDSLRGKVARQLMEHAYGHL
jgi:hypothetical protein